MKGKLILTLDGSILREHAIDRDAITIGRRHGNDIQLNDITVSGRHALVSEVGGRVYVEDLGSTNGTLVNGKPVRKQFLKHGDVIQVGAHQLAYFDPQVEYQETMFIKAEMADTQVLPGLVAAPSVKGQPLAATRLLNGPMANTVWEMRKPFNTVGYKGMLLAVIARGVDGYSIAEVRSIKSKRATDIPLVNGQQIGKTPRPLKEHDLIEIAGVRMEFLYVR